MANVCVCQKYKENQMRQMATLQLIESGVIELRGRLLSIDDGHEGGWHTLAICSQ
jgi:hypothetical protein